jgi:hypothetical protein
MATARIGAGVTTAADPSNAAVTYIYVLGGLDVNGATLASYEILPITTAGDGTQTTAAFAPGGLSFTNARWRLGAFTVSPRDTTLVGASTYVWAGCGSDAGGGNMLDDFDGAVVTAGGQLGAFSAISAQNPQSAGYGAFAAGDYLYVLGGHNGDADIETMNARHSGTAPGLQDWQGFGPGLTDPRVDLGAAVQSGHFYIVGGTTDTATASTTVEYVLY